MRYLILIIIISIFSGTLAIAASNAPSIEEYNNIRKGVLMPEIISKEKTNNSQNSYSKKTMTLRNIKELYQRGNYKKIQKNLFLLAKKGNHEAEELIGIMYKRGEGFIKNTKKSVIWLLKAANAKRPLAQHHMGVMYYTSDGVTQDMSKSLMWLKLASLYYIDKDKKALVKKDYNDVFKSTNRRDRSRSVELTRDWLSNKNDLYLLDIQR